MHSSSYFFVVVKGQTYKDIREGIPAVTNRIHKYWTPWRYASMRMRQQWSITKSISNFRMESIYPVWIFFMLNISEFAICPIKAVTISLYEGWPLCLVMMHTRKPQAWANTDWRVNKRPGESNSLYLTNLHNRKHHTTGCWAETIFWLAIIAQCVRFEGNPQQLLFHGPSANVSIVSCDKLVNT